MGNQSRSQFGDGRQHIDVAPTTHGSNLGDDAHSRVVSSDSQSVPDGRVTKCLEVAPPNITSPKFVQEKSSGVVPGAKDARRPHQHQDYSSTHTNSGFQHLSHGEGNEFGCSGTHVDFVPKEGENKGDAGDDGMKFKEGSGATTPY